VPDREPIYVAVDPGTDAVRRVLFDRTHYLVGTTAAPPLDGDKPLLHVVTPWHQYTTTTEAGQLVELRDLTDRYEAWLGTGWRVDRRSVVDPPSVEPRGHWWPSNSFGFSLTAMLSPILAEVPALRQT